jgi:hypothetical protein
MTLIELIEYAAVSIRNGISRQSIDLEFVSMGVDMAVAAEIFNTLNDDGSYRRYDEC